MNDDGELLLPRVATALAAAEIPPAKLGAARLERLSEPERDLYFWILRRVAALCGELDLRFRVVRDDGGHRRGALVNRRGELEVQLFRSNASDASIRAHERFTIAHEIGHALVWRGFKLLPTRRRDYWRHEDACNGFASLLLIPPDLVSEFAYPQDADGVAEAVNAIARRAGVTAEPAARSLAKCLTIPVAIGELRISPLATTKRVGFRAWWVETRSWLGRTGARRLAIYSHDPLAPVIETLQNVEIGAPARPLVPGSSSSYLRRRRHDAGSFAAVLAM